jgi:multidrug resistance efflux pump
MVFDIGYREGDIATPERKLLSIANLDSIIVQANVVEEFIKDVKVGAEVTIIPQADKTKTYKGKVIYISSKAILDNGVTEVPTHISIDSKDGFLLPGFNVDVKINVAK